MQSMGFQLPRAEAESQGASRRDQALLPDRIPLLHNVFHMGIYINAARQDPEARRRAMLKADVHMRFVMGLYEEQVKDGHYFLHEHPAWATSWQLGCVKKP